MFKDFITDVNRINLLLANFPLILERFTYLVAYNYMLIIIDTEVRKHPEGQKYNEMAEIMLDHFANYAVNYIDMDLNTLVDEEEAGLPIDLLNWQKAAYSLNREPETYLDRIKVWKEIFEGIATDKEQRRNEKGQFYYVPIGPKTGRDGRPVTYKSIMEKRHMTRPSRDMLPFWYPINYGNNVGYGGGPGYPNVPGIGFKERAEAEISRIRSAITPLVDDYAAYLLHRAENQQPINDTSIDDILSGSIKRKSASVSSIDISRKKWLRKRPLVSYGGRSIESLAIEGW